MKRFVSVIFVCLLGGAFVSWAMSSSEMALFLLMILLIVFLIVGAWLSVDD